MLKYPYPRDVEEPDEYETVRVHAEWGKTRDQSVRDKSNLAVSIIMIHVCADYFLTFAFQKCKV